MTNKKIFKDMPKNIKEIDSPIYGKTTIASDQKIAVIREIVMQHPISVFQAVNQHLNSLGHCISITLNSEQDNEREPS